LNSVVWFSIAWIAQKKQPGPLQKKAFSQEKIMKTTVKLLNNNVLLRFGASCKLMGRPVGFLPSLHHFWAFLLNRTAKKLTGFKKNATGPQKT
jgi:hypothetical protein